MSKFSFSVYLNAYSDPNASNNPAQNNFKWSRDVSGLIVNNPVDLAASVAPGETRDLFLGSRTLAQDNTTQYSIALKPLSTNTYVLSWEGGAAPNFRAPRAIGADATTELTAQTNGPIVTFSSTAGTLLDMSTSQVGDQVTIGSQFNTLNQGSFKIIAKTADSFTIENPSAVNEVVTLGASFAELEVCSAAGVQINDTLKITGGFSLVTQGSYKVTAVRANDLEFYFSDLLPQEGPITTDAIAIYSNAKNLVYIEASSPLDVIVNGVNVGKIEPFFINSQNSPSLPGQLVPGVFMLRSTIYSLSVTNNGTDSSNIFFAAVE